MIDAQRLTLALGGTWRGHYGLAYCPAHDNHRTPALSLGIGDNGQLLLCCFAGCSFASVMQACRALGHDISQSASLPLRLSLPTERAANKAEAQKREAQARSIWEQSQRILGTLAETYLREARGIDCPLPPTLRFHPECWHGATAQRLPAMIALVTGAQGFGVHRTYLCADGSGKTQVAPAKAMLGTLKGGAVHLAQGSTTLAIAEGIETALSLQCGPLNSPVTVWAGLSSSGLSSVQLPQKPGQLIIASDGDSAGQKAAIKLAARASLSGWQVTLFPAPTGRDWNDVIRSHERATK